MATIENLKQHIRDIEARENYQRPIVFGIGIRKKRRDTTLEVFYPHINYESNYGTAALLRDASGFQGNKNGFVALTEDHLKAVDEEFEPIKGDGNNHPNADIISLLKNGAGDNGYFDTDVIAYFLFDTNTAVESPEEGYFKTQCLSQLLVKPHDINCSGIFGKMNNVAWTNQGPILPKDLAAQRLKYILQGTELVVSHVDKFPYMVNYHVPEGVRIVSGSKVRLGAYLSPGTTVMPAGFVNFNAGTLGNAMVEGRISGGVVVDENSDIGGGASIMGTLSGGNKNVISIGKNCLLGANAGTGISLGDGCTIAAGVYVTAAAKVALYNAEKQPIDLSGNTVEEGKNIVKGIELNGRDYLLYYNDSQTGRLTARPNTKVIELNKSLHA